MTDLISKHCVPYEGGVPALPPAKIKEYLADLPKWTLSDDGADIKRVLQFKNFHETMAAVNAIAWIAHQENHHPDLSVGYDYCRIVYSTHAIGGLTENDFICAAKIENILFG